MPGRKRPGNKGLGGSDSKIVAVDTEFALPLPTPSRIFFNDCYK